MDDLQRSVCAVIRALEAGPVPLPTDTPGVHFPYATVPFRNAARALVNALDEEALRRLTTLFSEAPQPTQDYRPSQPDISRSFAWTTQWAITVAEILYQADGRAVPALREAFLTGQKDALDTNWAMALEVYAHLAADGVETEGFVKDVRQALSQTDDADAQGFRQCRTIVDTASRWETLRSLLLAPEEPDEC